jgi:hypothetical protein
MYGAGLRVSASPHCIQSLHSRRMLLTISVMFASLQLLAQALKAKVQKSERNKP